MGDKPLVPSAERCSRLNSDLWLPALVSGPVPGASTHPRSHLSQRPPMSFHTAQMARIAGTSFTGQTFGSSIDPALTLSTPTCESFPERKSF